MKKVTPAQAWRATASKLEGVTLRAVRELKVKASLQLGPKPTKPQLAAIHKLWVPLAVQASETGEVWTDAAGNVRAKPKPKPPVTLKPTEF